MANTVIGLYNDSSTAERVIDDLTSSGFDRSIIEMHRESDASGLHDELTDEGIPRDDADYYVEGLRDGGVLVSVHADESDTDKAVDIMNRYANEGGYEDSRDFDDNIDSANLGTGVDRDVDRDVDRTSSRGVNTSGDETIEVAEEQLRIGKRRVNRGGVRVRSRVVEEEISEDVTLRDEEIHVDREKVDRKIDAADGDLFQERTIEVTETDEEAVVSKEAHVTEEIHVSKDATDRTETVSDTVRRTEVDVEDLDADSTRTETRTDTRTDDTNRR